MSNQELEIRKQNGSVLTRVECHSKTGIRISDLFHSDFSLCLTAMFCLLLLSSCEHSIFDLSPADGEHLELTSVAAAGPGQLKLHFSEMVNDRNTGTGYFQVVNASTGKILPVASVTPANQTVTLSLGMPNEDAPFQLVAGHVYDVIYRVAARDNMAEAKGTWRFEAAFLPSASPEPSAWVDSAGTVMILWTPDRRTGNTAQEIWRRNTTFQTETETRIQALGSDAAVYWAPPGPGGTETFALIAVNEYGEGPRSGWAPVQDAGIGAFVCRDVCLSGLAWADLPDGYERMDNRTTCHHVEYRNAETGTRLIRRFSPPGIEQVRVTADSVSVDSVFNWCL